MWQVQAVDLDPVVVAAARQAMGFPADRCAWSPTLATPSRLDLCMLLYWTRTELA